MEATALLIKGVAKCSEALPFDGLAKLLVLTISGFGYTETTPMVVGDAVATIHLLFIKSDEPLVLNGVIVILANHK
tara:strand:- start:201 stop:428 length:228 start_codon:yes stop_codon:yes gene_type:complete